MPLRLLEFSLSAEDVERLPELLGDQPTLHVWRSGPAEGTGTVRILLEAEHVEALSDALADRFGSGDDFRMVLLPVEATLPRVDEPQEAAAGEPPADEEESRQRMSREELYQDVAQASRLTATYAVMVGLSAVVAAVGMMRGDVAIVIGAMVIAPLLGPNMAVSLGCTLGDLDLVRSSVKVLAVGLAIAVGVSFAVGLVIDVDPSLPELAARTRPGLGDIALALAAGAAGSLAFTGGVAAVLVGVMVAVALLPPLVAVGLFGGGGHWTDVTDASLLLLTNLTCINLAAVATFLAQKVRPRTWWEAERARRATKVAVTTWVVMLVLLLVVMLLSGVG